MNRIEEIASVYKNRRPVSNKPFYYYQDDTSLHIHFASKGCRYDKCYCCDYGYSSKGINRSDIDKAFDMVVPAFMGSRDYLLVGTFGNIFDSSEFDPDLFDYLVSRLRDTCFERIAFEVSWNSITSETLDTIHKLADVAKISVECGLESSNDTIRQNCYNKQVSQQQILEAITLAHSKEIEIVANVMYGAPFLDERERFVDAISSIEWAVQSGIDQVVLFPVNIKPYTLLRALFDFGLYEPISIRDTALLIENLDDSCLDKLAIAWWGDRDDEYSIPSIKPVACEVCKPVVASVFRDFNRGNSVHAKRDALCRLLDVNACGCRRVSVLERTDLPSKKEIDQRKRIIENDLVRYDLKNALVWCGPRQSDTDYSNVCFANSVTVYGEGTGGSYSYCEDKKHRFNHNDVTEEQISSIAKAQLNQIRQKPQTRILYYNPYYAFEGNRDVINRCLCMNDFSILCLLEDKLSFRNFASQFVDVVDYSIIDLKEKDYLSGITLKENERYVVQDPLSSGGLGTYLVDVDEVQFAVDSIANTGHSDRILISKYYDENIPLNMHAVVFEDEILLLMPSVQIIVENNGKLLYRGCDYVCYQDISQKYRDAFAISVNRLCQQLQSAGFRGVIGFDVILTGGQVLFLEANPRFQASTNPLNKMLVSFGLPSIHELHMQSFCSPVASISQSEIAAMNCSVSAMSYSSSANGICLKAAEHIFDAAVKDEAATLVLDGDFRHIECDEDAFLFSVIFAGRIANICDDRILFVSDNVNLTALNNGVDCDLEKPNDFLRFKIALLNQGAVISDSAKAYFRKHGMARMGVNESIDLYIDKDNAINVPLNARYSTYSPFTVEVGRDRKLYIAFLGRPITGVSYQTQEHPAALRLRKNVPLEEICFFATDRLRIQHNNRCDYVDCDKGCSFCDFPPGVRDFTLTDILDAFDDCMESSKASFNHVLIGGGTNASNSAYRNIAYIVRHIRSRTDMPIYVMSTPPRYLTDLDVIKDAGVTEVAFNIELFDRELARRFMPAKGQIPLEDYIHAFERSVELWGNTGNVRCAFVLGLEPMESLLQGCELVASKGVSPMLSIFRPMKGTIMDAMIPPTNEWIEEAYWSVLEICEHYHVPIGPSCKLCRNNMVVI